MLAVRLWSARSCPPRAPPRTSAMVNVRFVYRGAGARVCIAGDWSQWAPLDMAKEGDDQCWVFEVDLQPVQHVAFKFIVDGEWKTAAGYQLVDNGLGDENNTLYIPAVKNEEPAKREESEPVAVHVGDVPADEVVDAKVEEQPAEAEEDGGEVDEGNEVDNGDEVDESEKSGEVDEGGTSDEVYESEKSGEVDEGGKSDESLDVTEDSNEEEKVLGDDSEELDTEDVAEEEDVEKSVDKNEDVDVDVDEGKSEEVIPEADEEAKKICEEEEKATKADVAKRRESAKVGNAIGEEKSGCVLV